MRRLLPLALLISLPALAQVEGKFAQALDASVKYAAAPPNQVYTVLPLTVELFARLSDKSAHNILLANEPKNSVTHWEIFADKSTGHLCAFIPGFAPADIKSKTDIVDGQWHYIAMTHDGQMVRLFVDGKEALAQKIEKKFSYPDVGPLTFGRIEDVPSGKGILIDEVRISRIVRDCTKVPDAPFKPDGDTIGLWHFDGDGKSGYADLSTTRNAAKFVESESGKPPVAEGKNRWAQMDHGPFFSSTLGVPGEKGNITMKGVTVRLGTKEKPAAVCFDTELLRVSAAWTDGFIKLHPGREGLGQHPDQEGKGVYSTSVKPGWAKGDSFDDPRADKLGPLPDEHAKYRGLYVNGDRVVFAYTVAGVEVLETHDLESTDSGPVFARTIDIAPSTQPLSLNAAEFPGAKGTAGDPRNLGGDTRVAAADGTIAVLSKGDVWRVAVARNAPADSRWHIDNDAGRITLALPSSPQARLIRLAVGTAQSSEKTSVLTRALISGPRPVALRPLTQPGPARWGEPLITKGVVSKDTDSPYVVDTITAPDDNPFKSYLRFAGHDFFPNGDIAVCSVSGDVWIVSNINDTLDQLKWRRFATGLHQPLGLRIIDEKIHVLGRDQITKLHDLNNDGEADFYECFNNGCKTTTNGHAYATNLETDPAGNFYFTKCADNTNFGGSVVKVSKDGKTAEPLAVGLRNPNGLGISPEGLITAADNQGDWVPASRIDVVEPGKFLGYKPMSKGMKADSVGKPMLYLPQNIDSSSGGQTWVATDTWGLPKGTMLHTSYGGVRLVAVYPEKVEGTWQAAAVAFPLKFDSGVMRARFSPKDGHLYLSGLRGWQTTGLRPGALQRVRYTGKPLLMPTAVSTHANGVKVSFATALDRASAEDAGNYSALRWAYKWTSDYPSRHFSVENPKKQGYDAIDVKSVKLAADGKTLFIEIPDIAPVAQQQITMNIKSADGTTVRWDVYQTVHALVK